MASTWTEENDPYPIISVIHLHKQSNFDLHVVVSESPYE